jgi:uncharacterized membrane protein
MTFAELPLWQTRAACAASLGVAGVVIANLAGAASRGSVVDIVFVGAAIMGAFVASTAPRVVPWLLGACFLSLAMPVAAQTGWRGLGTMASLIVIGLLALGGAHRAETTTTVTTKDRRHLQYAGALAALAFVIYSLFAVERHRRFGSGSWDYGCYVHNAWLFAHGDALSLSARSSVLGDVAWWGGTNHFMPSLVFTAPLAWWMEWTRDTSWLAVAQAGIVAAAAMPLAILARRRGLSPLVSAAIVAAFLWHLGTQAALIFDVHEIAPVPLLLFVALLIVEDPPTTRRVALLGVVLFIWAGTKESSWLGVASFGLALVGLRRPWRPAGGAVFIVAVIGFVIVVGVIQPSLLEEGSRGMIHAARFRGVDDQPATTLIDALRSIVAHPGRAVAALTTPTEKIATFLTSSLGFGHLPLLSPTAWLIGGANLAERFLSDKREMWGLAFHYGLVTAAWLAVGAVEIAARYRHRSRLCAGVIVAGMVCSFLTAARAPDLVRYEQPYFADPPSVARFQRALREVDENDAVVAQNHFLPHVALRRDIWLPEERFVDRADVIVLDTAASAWPHTPQHIRRLVARLRRDLRFSVVFEESTTLVFRRRDVVP